MSIYQWSDRGCMFQYWGTFNFSFTRKYQLCVRAFLQIDMHNQYKMREREREREREKKKNLTKILGTRFNHLSDDNMSFTVNLSLNFASVLQYTVSKMLLFPSMVKESYTPVWSNMESLTGGNWQK